MISNSPFNNSAYINTALLILFIGMGYIGILYHEIWLDEAHHWLLARDSKSLAELFSNSRYEGHPILWNIILFVISRFTSEVFYIQIANLAFTVLAVWLFLFFSPFNIRSKFLFILGYFILYEYSVISRNYTLIILFFFLALVLYHRKSYLTLCIPISLLANSHLFGLIIAVCFVVMIIHELLTNKITISKKEIAISLSVLIITFGISLWQIVPPLDSTLYLTGQKSPAFERLARTSIVFCKSFIPIPDIRNYNYWNTNLVSGFSSALSLCISSLIFVLPIIIFRNRSVLLFFYAASLCILTFIYLSDFQAVRYYGLLYLIFIGCKWNLSSNKDSTSVMDFRNKVDDFFFTIILILQMTAGVLSFSLDLLRPFSESKNLAKFLAIQNPNRKYVANGCAVASVSAYLGTKIFYLSENEYGSFCYFNRQGKYSIQKADLATKDLALNYVYENKQAVYLITTTPLSISQLEHHSLKLLGSFDKSVVKKENFFLYVLEPDL